MLLQLKENQRLVDFLNIKSYGKILFIFNHGLGDLINFLPLVEALRERFSNFKFDVGIPIKKNLLGFPNVIFIDKPIKYYFRSYSYIYIVKYPEPSHEEKIGHISKPYLCNDYGIGLKYFIWKPYKMNIKLNNQNSKMIGFHFFGNSCKKYKDVPVDRLNILWKEVKNCGYIPFEITMCNNDNYIDFITNKNSLRFEKADILRMIQKISECKYFVGIDSGPFYLAGSILGLGNCIGMERFLKFEWYLPYKIKKVNISFYKKGCLTKIIQELDNEKEGFISGKG